MGKIEKIRQEIERQMKFYDEKEREVLDDPKQFTYALFYQGHQKMCAKLLSFLDTLSEEPDKSLEEAAEEYRRESFKKSVIPQIDGPISVYGGNIKSAFKAGAEWEKEQMLKDAVEGKIYGYDDGSFELIVSWLDMPKNPIYKDGDKVRIIIVKEEKQ